MWSVTSKCQSKTCLRLTSSHRGFIKITQLRLKNLDNVEIEMMMLCRRLLISSSSNLRPLIYKPRKTCTVDSPINQIAQGVLVPQLHAMSSITSSKPTIHPTIQSIRSMRKSLNSSKSVGFVPTMGALHEGKFYTEGLLNHQIHINYFPRYENV